jgi:DNA-binding NtrC family response regulator
MSPELIASELFGHEKGAFTGAVGRRVGLFVEAQDGTLFLDEVTEMPLAMQTNLLRVLETKTVIPLGTTASSSVNCRVVSATNRTEQQIVDNNCLREDIYYRLAVFPLHIPPLREKMADVPLLVKGFLDTLNRENGTQYKLSEADLKRLQLYDWPGNVRELRHVLHRAWIMGNPEQEMLHLPERFDSPFSRRKPGHQSLKPELAGRTIEEVEKELIMQTLDRFENNKTKAAEALGVSVKTLYNRLSSYGVEDANHGG